MEATAGRRDRLAEAGATHLRCAIGAYRGSTLKRVVLAVTILWLLVGSSGLALYGTAPVVAGYMILGFAPALFSFLLYVFLPPLASRGAMDAERAWTTSLPFPLLGYFELLSSQPGISKTIVYEIRWRPGARPPERGLLHSVVGAVDPHARIDEDGGRAVITSGSVDGSTGIRVNNVPVYRNHRLPAAVHGVVERVLVILHRSHPIAEVKLGDGRGW